MKINTIIISLLSTLILFNYPVKIQGQSNEKDSLLISYLQAELAQIKAGATELTRQLDSISALLDLEIEQNNMLETEFNLIREEFDLAKDTIASLKEQITQFSSDREYTDSVSQIMKTMYEPLNKKAEESEERYQKIKNSTLFDELNIELINNLTNDLELLNDLFPGQKYSSYLKELNEIKIHIASVASAKIVLNQPFNYGTITEAQRNLKQIGNTSIAYNEAREAINLLSIYKSKLEIFENLLKSIKSIDNDYKSLNNTTYNRRHYDEILKYVDLEREDIEVIPFLKRKLEELLKIKENNVHEDVSNILKQE